MISKWIIVLSLAIVLLSLGAALGLQDGSEGPSSGPLAGPATPATSAEAQPAAVAGIWSLVLMDGATGRSQPAEVEIIQIGEVVFGRGTSGGAGAPPAFLPVEAGPRPTRDEGIKSMVWWLHQDPPPAGGAAASTRYLTIGASGIVTGPRVSLDLIFLDQNVLCRLDLQVFGSFLSGSYIAYDSRGTVGTGSCTGSIRPGYALPLDSSPQVLHLGRSR